MTESINAIELAAEIVSAYVSNNSVPAAELATLLNDVHTAIVRVSTGAVVAPVEPSKPAAVSVSPVRAPCTPRVTVPL